MTCMVMGPEAALLDGRGEAGWASGKRWHLSPVGALRSMVGEWGLEPRAQVGLVVGAGLWPGERLAGEKGD